MYDLKRILLGTAIVFGGSIVATAQAGPGFGGPIEEPQDQQTVPNFGPIDEVEEQRYIIQYKNGARNISANRVAVGAGQIVLEVANRNIMAVNMSKGAAMALKGDPSIQTIEIDPRRYLMAEETPYGIPMVQADMVSDAGVGSQKVCIMDTGYDRQHVDLQAIRVDGNDGHGSYDTGNWYEDGHGHGTHVAGTIAALGGNDEGVVGVNPGNNLNLHIVKVFNNSGNWAYGSDLIAAINQCVDAGSNVISMSLGGGGSSAAEQAAFENAQAQGVLSIAAAGNGGNSVLSYPASYDAVMSVGAVDSNANIASFSQFNSQVEISAPGVAVLSTLPNNQYASWNGTSMATPHVSGVAALVWSHYPSCSSEQIRAAINLSAEDRGASGRDHYYGYGIVKAKDAFDLLANGCDIDTTPPPPVTVVLENGVAETGLAGAAQEELLFSIEIPARATDLMFEMTGGTGDADMYVKAAEVPTQTSYDCRPYKLGNEEICTFATPQTETYYVMVRAFSAFDGASLTATYTEGEPNQPPKPSFTHSCSALDCDFDASSSTDDGEIVKFGWRTGDIRNKVRLGEQVSHTYSGPGTYKVLLVATDDDNVLRIARKFIPVGDNIVARMLKRQLPTRNTAHPRWSGANGANVDIYFNGAFHTSTPNDGVWWHIHQPVPATYTYKICETGSTSLCSNDIEVVFE